MFKKINNKGQVFSLDYMLAIVAMFFILSYIFAFFEISTYTNKDAEINSELKQIAENAIDILSTSEKYTCKLKNSEVSISNCLYYKGADFKANFKKNLGIPENYKCYINLPFTADSENPCLTNNVADDPKNPNITRIYTASRMVLLATDSQTITRQELQGLSEGSAISKTPLVLMIWKE